MDFISWTSDGVNVYLKDTVKFIPNDEFMLYLVVIGIALGLMIGVVISYITRVNSYRAVKALIAEGANTPETAKRVDQLNVRKKKLIKRLLRDGKLLRKVVLAAEDENSGKKTDVNTAAFYIPEEKRIAAEVRYSREGMSPPALVITIIVIAAAAVGALYVIPELITMAGNVFGNN